MASPSGGIIFVNNNVQLSDSIQDTIFIREEDQAILATSLNNFIFSNGAAVYAGPALRNKLNLYDAQGNRIPSNGSPVSLHTGKDNIYIVPHGDPITYDTKYYTEYRIDVEELGDGKLDLNDINSSSPLSNRDPIIRQVLGNYIGADIENPQQYGALLKARLFTSSDDNKGGFNLEKAIQTNGIDEPSILGLVYALHSLKTGAFLGFDKEGHCYLNLAASQANPVGSGRSMSILAQGNLKEIWGASADINNSWDLTTRGGARWNIGAHNLNRRGRSLDIKTSRGITINVGSADDDGFAKSETLQGNVSETISGDKTQTVINLTNTINGMKTEHIGGSASETIQSDKSINVLGVYSETVVKEKQSKLGVRKTTITSGNDELTVIRGDITETIQTFGKRSTLVTAGSIENTLLSGTFTNSVKAGSYTISVNAGAISIKTDAGTVSMNGSVVNINGTALVNVTAPLVRIGSGAPIGGALTGLPGIPSDFDRISGTPFLGSFKVGIAR
jgi:hypothetical protein